MLGGDGEGSGVGAELGGVDAVEGADAVREGAGMAHPEVVLDIVVAFAEVVDVAVDPLVADVDIVPQAVVPPPAAGGGHGLEGGGPLVGEHHVVEVARAVDVDMHTYAVARTKGLFPYQGEAPVGIDAAEGLAEREARAVVLDAVDGCVVAVEEGTPGGGGVVS